LGFIPRPFAKFTILDGLFLNIDSHRIIKLGLKKILFAKFCQICSLSHCFLHELYSRKKRTIIPVILQWWMVILTYQCWITTNCRQWPVVIIDMSDSPTLKSFKLLCLPCPSVEKLDPLLRHEVWKLYSDVLVWLGLRGCNWENHKFNPIWVIH
jgi:hypothetical protein